MARKHLQLRRKRPLPKGRIVLNMTNRDKAKWEGGDVGPSITDPWTDPEQWVDDLIWNETQVGGFSIGFSPGFEIV